MLAKSQTLYRHDLDSWKFSKCNFIMGPGLSQIFRCPVSWVTLYYCTQSYICTALLYSCVPVLQHLLHSSSLPIIMGSTRKVLVSFLMLIQKHLVTGDRWRQVVGETAGGGRWQQVTGGR